jgi:hypothetical protein
MDGREWKRSVRKKSVVKPDMKFNEQTGFL